MNYDEYIEKVREEIPSFAVIRKRDSWLMKVIDVILKIISFGQIKEFMDNYTTTIGSKICVPDSWETKSDNSRIITIRHEVVHIRQFKKYTFPLYIFLYLFVFFPIGLAYFRMKFEKAGYREGTKAALELLGDKYVNNEYKEHIIRQFTSSSYFWCWPFRKSIETWYNNMIREVREEINKESTMVSALIRRKFQKLNS